MDTSLRTRDRRRQRAAIGGLVLALHVLLGLALLSTIVRQRSRPESPRVSVRLLPAPQRVEQRTSPSVAPARPPVSSAVRAQVMPRSGRRAVEATERSVPADEAPITTAEAASAPASTPSGTDLLDTEASRRAIRSAARNPNLASRVDEQVGVHSPTAAQRLPGNIRQAGKGDCMKGQYPGAGMGLLSLPFLAAALGTGNCAQ